MSHLKNITNQQELAQDVIEAKSLWQRTRGLLGYSDLDSSRVMWITPCSSIHTWFMKFSIDAVFVDKNLKVKSIHPNLSPGKMVFPKWGHHSVFEFKAGKLESCSLNIGDQLYVGD